LPGHGKAILTGEVHGGIGVYMGEAGSCAAAAWRRARRPQVKARAARRLERM
jgi:hypothetical protein